jgi:hypothetical protein
MIDGFCRYLRVSGIENGKEGWVGGVGTREKRIFPFIK